MALVRSASLTNISGSLGGMTFARNKGGLYVRNRSGTTNPNSPRQQAVRTAMANMSQLYASITNLQQGQWVAYASAVSVVNRLGESTKLSAHQHFVRSNVARVTAGLAPVLNGPSELNLGTLSPVTITAINTVNQTYSIGFNATDAWAETAGGALLVFAGAPRGNGVSFFKGPWKYSGLVNGAATPPTSPSTQGAIWPVSAGQRVWVRVVATLADGRLTADQIIFRQGV